MAVASDLSGRKVSPGRLNVIKVQDQGQCLLETLQRSSVQPSQLPYEARRCHGSHGATDCQTWCVETGLGWHFDAKGRRCKRTREWDHYDQFPRVSYRQFICRDHRGRTGLPRLANSGRAKRDKPDLAAPRNVNQCRRRE